MPEKTLVKPSRMMAPTQTKEPTIINGLRLPNLEREWSASTPISGCTINPLSGPAMKTMDMSDFDRPKESKYGEAAEVPKLTSLMAKQPRIAYHIPFQHSRLSEDQACQPLRVAFEPIWDL